jgi:serine phosphatase RsbU (regulator of sigma subunit)
VTNLDRMFAAFELSQFVTLAYLVVDPGRDQMTLINAGHLPPLVVSATGEVHQPPVTTSLPLGVQPDLRTADVVPLPPGSCVAVFTDGLVERRGEDIDVGVARLAEQLRSLPGRDLALSVRDLVAAMHDEERQDDVTLLVARRAGK